MRTSQLHYLVSADFTVGIVGEAVRSVAETAFQARRAPRKFTACDAGRRGLAGLAAALRR
jgi:hypothetical protein